MMTPLDNLALNVCPVGHNITSFVDEQYQPDENDEPAAWAYSSGRTSDLFTSTPLDMLWNSEVTAKTKFWQFTFGSTTDALCKIGHNLLAIGGNTFLALIHLVLAIIRFPAQTGETTYHLRALTAHLSMDLSNIKEIVRNLTRICPIVGHFTGCLGGKLINWIGKREPIATLLKHKFALEFNYASQVQKKPERLKVIAGILLPESGEIEI